MPGPLDGVEFRAVGRERHEGDVGWHDEVAAGVPSCPVDDDGGMGAEHSHKESEISGSGIITASISTMS
jgi:hypothetical protein